MNLRAVASVATMLPGLCGQAPSPELAAAAAAYAAKVAASALFVSGRTLDSVLDEELAPTRPIETLIRPLLRFEVDKDNRTVTCRLGAAAATAVATKSLGCTLATADASIDVLRRRGAPSPASIEPDPSTVDWPLGDRMPSTPSTSIDQKAVAAAVAAAFVESPGRQQVNTRAVVVLHRGQLVAEQYAPDCGPSVPLPGWSMTKSLTFVLVQLAIEQRKWRFAVPEWQASDDARRAIETTHLLSMTAGLSWNEDYDDPHSDSLRMLFSSSDHAAAYAAKQPVAAPGASFHYSSGGTNLLCRILRRSFDNDLDYWAFPQQLFQRLGMRSAILETDPSGTFVGSSYGFASARDWARLGLLFQQRGSWAGERLLPATVFTAAGTPVAGSNGRYGAGVWLNADPDGDGPASREWLDLPADLQCMNGHEGQYCVVFPTDELVVVRLGCTKNGGFDLHALLRAVHRAASRD